MKNIKFKESFNNCRASIYKPETRQFLLSRIAGSEQEKDMSVPSNCDGYGRIHHFRRNVDKWVQDPLPNDPACKALEIPYTDLLEAQVFQLASCNVHCWYCFVPDELKRGRIVNAKWDIIIKHYQILMESIENLVLMLDILMEQKCLMLRYQYI